MVSGFCTILRKTFNIKSYKTSISPKLLCFFNTWLLVHLHALWVMGIWSHCSSAIPELPSLPCRHQNLASPVFISTWTAPCCHPLTPRPYVSGTPAHPPRQLRSHLFEKVPLSDFCPPGRVGHCPHPSTALCTSVFQGNRVSLEPDSVSLNPYSTTFCCVT